MKKNNTRSIDSSWGLDELVYLDSYDPKSFSVADCKFGEHKCSYYFGEYSDLISAIGGIITNGIVPIKFKSGLFANYWFKDSILHREDMPALTRLYPSGVYSFIWVDHGKEIKSCTNGNRDLLDNFGDNGITILNQLVEDFNEHKY